jgi:hypothetical protein
MIFDELRRQNPGFYTEHPFLKMSDEELQRYCPEGMSLDAFKMMCFQPSEEMTCPLCGRPQNHLSDCKGCGKFAFTSWDFLDVYGEEAPKRLKTELKAFLERQHPGARAEFASQNAFDCMVCVECWKETIQTSQAYLFCPLKLFSERILHGDIVQGLLYLGRSGEEVINILKQGVASYLSDPKTAPWRQPFYELVLSHKET